jgi:hypothetical protein
VYPNPFTPIHNLPTEFYETWHECNGTGGLLELTALLAYRSSDEQIDNANIAVKHNIHNLKSQGCRNGLKTRVLIFR